MRFVLTKKAGCQDMGRGCIKVKKTKKKPQTLTGYGFMSRTDTELPPLDFESSASTNFTTPAQVWLIPYFHGYRQPLMKQTRLFFTFAQQ